MKKIILSFLILSNFVLCNAGSNSDKTIETLYQNAPKPLKATARLDWFSRQFIGIPYQLGPLGEGDSGRYDQSPLYRFDKFDCQTYVETVMALAISNSPQEFKTNIDTIRYADDEPNYLTRNHFISLDWLPNNRQKGLVTDITCHIVGANNAPICQTATAEIDKAGWLMKKPLADIKLKEEKLRPIRWQELKTHAKNYQPQTATINYLPLTTLFPNGQADHNIIKQIPSGSMITIVRPNWQLKDLIGTNLNTSHVGLAIKKGKHLYFREASQIKKTVSDTLLTTYLENYLDSPTIKGINVLKLNMPLNN